MLRLKDIDAWEDATLFRQKIASCFSGFLSSPDDDAAGGAVTVKASQDGYYSQLEPGKIQVLPSGTQITFPDPPQVADAGFYNAELRAVAAGLGIPAHLLTGDLSEVNYSSIRAAIVEFRHRVDAWQELVKHQLLMPVWRRFVTLAVLSGQIDAPGFETDPTPYLAVDWFPPAQDWVDPLKDAEANAVAIASGFKSRRQVVAETGRDVEDIDREIAEDEARAKKLGIVFGNAAAAITPKTAAQEAQIVDA
jgi:lambda family phage portal protein